jgi:membrane-associated phospholipid phosphatase
MRTARSSASLKSLWLGGLAGLLLQQAGGALASDTEDVGDVLRVAIPAAAFAVTIARDDREGRVQFYKSFGAAVAGTWALKELVEKERPDGTGDDAFPSGHAATAFQGAAFLHRRYGIRSAWWAYALATYTAWTRVDADEHDTADVLGGAAVGIASSFALAKRRNVEVSAMVDGDAIGLRISGRLK